MGSRRWFDYRTVPRRQRALILACMLFWSVLSYWFISSFVFSAAEVVGASMEPTMHDGERFILDKVSYRFRSPRRGEIVALRRVRDAELSVKRVIALPGERLQFKDSHVYVNGARLREPYLLPSVTTDPGVLSNHVYQIFPGSYFMLGDNRANSGDSRSFGAVAMKDIDGRVRDWGTR